jgi:hypothetical protein
MLGLFWSRCREGPPWLGDGGRAAQEAPGQPAAHGDGRRSFVAATIGDDDGGRI